MRVLLLLVLVLVLLLVGAAAMFLLREDGPSDLATTVVPATQEGMSAPSAATSTPIARDEVREASDVPVDAGVALEGQGERGADPEVEGTVVVIDEAGIEHRSESGRFSLQFHGHLYQRIGPEVTVEAGRWRARVPAGKQLSVHGLVLGGRPANDDAERLDPTKPPLEIRAGWVPRTTLRVRDAETRAELSEVLVVKAADIARSKQDHPGFLLRHRIVIEHGVSPIVLEPERAFDFNWSCTLHVGARGYTWQCRALNYRVGGEQEILLARAAVLEVWLLDVVADASPRLRVRAQSASILVDVAVTEDGPIVLPDLMPGACLVSVEIGEPPDAVLGREQVDLVAGGYASITLFLDPPPERPPRVPKPPRLRAH